MRAIRVETSNATVLLTEAAEKKVRDRQTGEIAKDAVSGEELMKVGVVFIDGGESSLLQVRSPPRRERLRHAWGVHAVYVRDVKPGVVELRLVGFDVLRKVRMPRKTGGGFLRVPVALLEDATPFVRDYRTIPHQLTLGATLSGKSMFLRHLVTGLTRQPVALAGIDCKRGVELAPFAPRLSAPAADPEQCERWRTVTT